MASTNQSANTEVIARWLDEAGNSVTEYSFYQLVELLNKLQGKSTTTQETTDEIIRFKSCANIAFPTRDVISVKKNQNGQFELEVSFLGLHGSQSPLPSYYLDDFAWEDAQQQPSVTDYLNLFNHRLVTLLHRIWRKYRYYICFENEGVDSFSRYMFSLVGLGNEDRKSTRLNSSH